MVPNHHIKPLYIKANFDGVILNRVLVNNVAAINILPLPVLKIIGKKPFDLMPTSVVCGFAGTATKAEGVVPMYVGFVTRSSYIVFFVIDANPTYQALLVGTGYIQTVVSHPLCIKH